MLFSNYHAIYAIVVVFHIEMMVSNQWKRLLELIMLNKDDHLADYLFISIQQSRSGLTIQLAQSSSILTFLFVRKKRENKLCLGGCNGQINTSSNMESLGSKSLAFACNKQTIFEYVKCSK